MGFFNVSEFNNYKSSFKKLFINFSNKFKILNLLETNVFWQLNFLKYKFRFFKNYNFEFSNT